MVVLIFILALIVISYGLYVSVTGLFTFFKNRTKVNTYGPETRFAVLIPARNEEEVIGSLIDSLKKQDYPQELYEIYTLINNCDDSTPDIAEECGANLMRMSGNVSSKGDVLKEAFEGLSGKGFDAFIVFDADNVVHPDFIKKMNNIYQSGYKVAQGRKDSKNMNDNWISAGYSLFYNLQNFFFNRARTHIKASATINGTGFMVSEDLVKDGFNPLSITEDIELSIMCILKGHKVVYCDDAITYDEQPTQFSAAWHQRMRWSKGIMQCTGIYSKSLFSRFLKEKDFSSLDKIFFMISPYMQVFALLPVILTVFAYAFHLADDSFLHSAMLTTSFGFAAGYFLTIVVCIFTIGWYKQDLKGSLSGIFLFMIFMMTWIPINIKCIIKKNDNFNWVPVRHCRNVDANALIYRAKALEK